MFCLSILCLFYIFAFLCFVIRASDFFEDGWAEVTHGAKNGGSFSEMMGPSISNYTGVTTVDIWVVYFTYTLTQTLVSIYEYTEKPV